MCEDISTARGVASGVATVRRGLFEVRGLRICRAAPDLLHSRAHALARDRAGHEHDLPVVSRDHPAARGRLLDRERHLLVW